MNTVIIATIILCACGLLAGAALGIASRVFAVKTDPRVEKIERVLPGANCSGCGNPSCYAYARAIVEENAEPNLCVLAADKAEEIGRIIGVEVSAKERSIAAVRCYGGNLSAKQFEYSGIPSCRAAGFFSGGDNACQFSCLGLGDCVRVCPFGALTQPERHTPLVSADACTGCGKCVEECPQGVIELIPATAVPHIACNTEEKGKIVRQICPIGCISCGKCVRECPESAISMVDNRIRIDYQKCNNCGTCIEVCPRRIIVRLGKKNDQGAVNL